MPPAHIRAVMRWVFLVQRDITQECCARVASFNEVVAKNQIVRQTILERSFECGDVVNAFADKGAFSKNILVNIGDDSRIRVDTRFIAKHPRIP